MANRCKHTTFLAHPRTRAECKDGPRPCPWVSCRYHLYIDVNGDTGSVKFNFPDREPWELEESCALDLAEDGASTFEEIGRCLNVTRERTRQLTSSALAKIVESLRAGGAIADDDVPRESRPQA